MLEYNFQPGKLILAIKRNHPFPDTRTCRKNILYGVDYRDARVIFPAPESGGDIGDVLLVYLVCQEKSTVIYLVDMLSSHPYVAYAEPSFFFSSHIIPNDEYFKYLWGLAAINAPSAWNYTVGGPDIIVGVVDSGVEHNHPDILGNMWVSQEYLPGWNFADNNSDSMDITGHGTHVAGTIGAVGNNYTGIAGVCWNIKIASLKIGNEIFSLAAAISSINFANANNIPILNNSWGSGQYSPILKHAIASYNGLYVASAGNYGADSDIYPDYPAAYDNDNIISVAATDPYNALAPFSNYGAKSVDIAAPGTDILSLGLYGEYSTQQGTSMSAPHVAGAAALLKSYMPGLSVADIKSIILQSAKTHPGLYGKILTGGVLDTGAMLELARNR